MKSERKLEGNELTVVLHGPIDSTVVAAFDEAIGDVSDIHSLVLDMADVDYISSAGLRVLMTKKLNACIMRHCVKRQRMRLL